MTAIEIAWAEIDKTLRNPMVAQIGGFRPPENVTSQFGGRFALPADMWPTIDGVNAAPILQLIMSELPNQPSWSNGMEALQIFIHPEELPIPNPSRNGEGFVVLEHLEVPDFAPWTPAEFKNWPKEFPIRWHVGEKECPVWEDLFNYVGMEILRAAIEENDGFDFYHDRYQTCYTTKIGGYPAYCQSATELSEDFVLQISSEEKPLFMVGDSGNLYFYIKEGEWWCDWDCY